MSYVIISENGPGLDVLGLIIVILLLLPNIIYTIIYRNVKNLCDNKVMLVIEQIGRYASMFFMIYHIGVAELGILSFQAGVVYFLGNAILVIAYCIVWILFFIKQNAWKSIGLAVVPTLLFLVNGLTQMYIPLIMSAVLFGVGHIYVTYQNIKKAV